MKPLRKRLFLRSYGLALGFLSTSYLLYLGPASAQLSQTLTPSKTLPSNIADNDLKPDELSQKRRTSKAGEDQVSLNFNNAELENVVRAISQFTGKTFIVDPRIKGQLSLVSETPVSRDQAYRMLLAALRLQSFSVIDVNGVIKIVPEADAKFQGASVTTSSDNQSKSPTRGDQMLTQIFRLNYESAPVMVSLLRPLISANNPINAYPGNNTIVITDYAENLQRIARIIAALDTSASTDIDIVKLEHAIASDIAAIVSKLMDPAAVGNADVSQRLSILAEPRTNSLLIRSSSAARTQLAKSLIARLDTPAARDTNMHVVYLKNAEATKLAQTLRGIFTGDNSSNSSNSNPSSLQNSALTANSSSTSNTSSTTPSNFTSNTSAAVGFSNGSISIQADPTTNTLIVTAPEPLYRGLREIIDALDVRRAQVFVETLIVEVTSDTAAEFGIQWQGGLNNISAAGTNVIGGTNFGGAGQNILSVAQNVASAGTGLNIGVIRGQVNVPGLGTITNLGFLARALESKNNANILSSPNLLTLDNEEAKIVIGQNVPFITGQYAATSGSASVNPFQTIDRKDVGLTLRVKPQVSEGGTVHLNIYQEVSSVLDKSLAAGIITNKRTVESNVLVDDGQIVVIGGLIQDSVTNTQDKVPGLGDVPVLGSLFRYDQKQKQKTSLMVFLRPYVIRDAAANQDMLVDRYDYMRRIQSEAKPTESWPLLRMEGPLLPARLPAVGEPLSGVGASKASIARDPAIVFNDSNQTILQVGVFPTLEAAQALETQLNEIGLSTYIESNRADKQQAVRVRLLRQAASVDHAIFLLRGMGLAPEIVTPSLYQSALDTHAKP